ncbi:MAG: ankyrin repeat domain-containing protein [Tatlockia sp.]|nr:ankyrin repeat domain-containing protein [Tatlockia sp.]
MTASKTVSEVGECINSLTNVKVKLLLQKLKKIQFNDVYCGGYTAHVIAEAAMNPPPTPSELSSLICIEEFLTTRKNDRIERANDARIVETEKPHGYRHYGLVGDGHQSPDQKIRSEQLEKESHQRYEAAFIQCLSQLSQENQLNILEKLQQEKSSLINQLEVTENSHKVAIDVLSSYRNYCGEDLNIPNNKNPFAVFFKPDSDVKTREIQEELPSLDLFVKQKICTFTGNHQIFITLSNNLKGNIRSSDEIKSDKVQLQVKFDNQTLNSIDSVSQGNEKIELEKISSKESKPLVVSCNDHTDLISATKKWNLDREKWLLRDDVAAILLKDKSYAIVLLWAASKSQPILQLLLHKGVEPEIDHPNESCGPLLQLAAMDNRLDVVQWLLMNQSFIFRNIEVDDALCYASLYQCEAVRLWLDFYKSLTNRQLSQEKEGHPLTQILAYKGKDKSMLLDKSLALIFLFFEYSQNKAFGLALYQLYKNELQTLLSDNQQQIIERISAEVNAIDIPEKLNVEDLQSSKIKSIYYKRWAEAIAGPRHEAYILWYLIKELDKKDNNLFYYPLISELQAFIASHEVRTLGYQLVDELLHFLNNSKLLTHAPLSKIQETSAWFFIPSTYLYIPKQSIYDLCEKMRWFLEFSNGNLDQKAVLLAASQGHIGLVKWLLKKDGALLTQKDNEGKNALILAVRKNHLDLIKWLVLEGGAEITYKDNKGRTILIWAAIEGKLEIVQWLLLEAKFSFSEEEVYLALDNAKENKSESVYLWLNLFYYLLKEPSLPPTESKLFTPIFAYTGKDKALLLDHSLTLLFSLFDSPQKKALGLALYQLHSQELQPLLSQSQQQRVSEIINSNRLAQSQIIKEKDKSEAEVKCQYYQRLAKAMTLTNEVWDFIKHFDTQAYAFFYRPLLLELQAFIALSDSKSSDDQVENKLLDFLTNSKLLSQTLAIEIQDTCDQFLQLKPNPLNQQQTDYFLSEVMRWLLKDGKGNFGHGTLVTAAGRGRLDVVKWALHKGGATIIETDDDGKTALLRAAFGGNLELVKWLLGEGGSVITERDHDGHTALLQASYGGNLDVVQWLLQEGGAKITEKDNEGDTALLQTVYGNELNLVQWLLKEGGAVITEKDNNGNTILLKAAFSGRSDIVRFQLQEGGSSITEKDNNGNTPLLRAIFGGDYSLVKWLLKKGGAKITEKNNGGDTALLLAVYGRKLELIKWLLNKGGAKPTEKNHCGETLLLKAASFADIDLVSWLIQEDRAKITEKDTLGRTALLRAAALGHLDLVKWLLKEGGAKVTEKDTKGRTALLRAAALGHLDLVKWLLKEGGAKITEKDNKGNSALGVAADRNNLHIILWLLIESGFNYTREEINCAYNLARLSSENKVSLWLDLYIFACTNPPLPIKLCKPLEQILAYSGKDKSELLHASMHLLHLVGQSPQTEALARAIHRIYEPQIKELMSTEVYPTHDVCKNTPASEIDNSSKKLDEQPTSVKVAIPNVLSSHNNEKKLEKDNKIQPLVINKDSDTAPLLGSEKNIFDKEQGLLSDDKSNLTEKNKSPKALLIAAERGELGRVKWLLEKGGASITEQDDEFGLTALLWAALNGHLDVVQWLLLEGGASITERDNSNSTALLLAAMNGHIGVVQWLLQAGGALITEKDESGDTALLWAAGKGHFELVRWLLRQGGAALTEKGNNCKTALHWAAEFGDLAMVQWLLVEGIFIYTKKEINLALNLAKENNKANILLWLDFYKFTFMNSSPPLTERISITSALAYIEIEEAILLDKRKLTLLFSLCDSPQKTLGVALYHFLVNALLEHNNFVLEKDNLPPIKVVKKGSFDEIYEAFNKSQYFQCLATALVETSSNGVWNFIKHFDCQANRIFNRPLILCLQKFIAIHDDKQTNEYQALYGLQPEDKLFHFLTNSEILTKVPDLKIQESCERFLRKKIDSVNQQPIYFLSKILQWLLQEGFKDITGRNGFSYTALMWAAKHGRLDVVKWLLQEGESLITEQNQYGDGDTVLLSAAEGGEIDLFKWLLQEGGASINKRYDFYKKALLKAAKGGKLEMFAFLLHESGGTDTEKHSLCSQTMLLAAEWGELDAVKYLICQGKANINERGLFNASALMLAASRGKLDTVKWLLKEGGASITDRNNMGDTALLRAGEFNKFEVVKWLLQEAGASITDKNRDNHTILVHAVQYSTLDNVYWLLIEGNFIFPLEEIELAFTLAHEDKANKLWLNFYKFVTLMPTLPLQECVPLLQILAYAEEDKALLLNKTLSLLFSLVDSPQKKSFGLALYQLYTQELQPLLSQSQLESLPITEKTKQTDLTLVHEIAVRQDLRVNEFEEDCLKENPPSTDVKYRLGLTPLLLAAKEGQLDVVQSLLKEGIASIHEKDRFGNTALLWAAMLGHLNLVEWLLKKGGASIIEKNHEQMTALLWAAYGGHINVVEWLLHEGGASINDKARGGISALIIGRNLELVKWLLQKAKVKITEKDDRGTTLLLRSARAGHLDLVKWLLHEGGASIAEKDNYDMTALLCAAQTGEFDMVRWLLQEGGAKITEEDTRGHTALLYTAGLKEFSLTRWLLKEGGAKITEQDKSGMTLLLLAAQYGQLELVKWLLVEGGAKITEKDKNGKTALLCAAQWDKLQLVKWLLHKTPAAISEKDNFGNTVLLTARIHRQLEVVHWLLIESDFIFSEKEISQINSYPPAFKDEDHMELWLDFFNFISLNHSMPFMECSSLAKILTYRDMYKQLLLDKTVSLLVSLFVSPEKKALGLALYQLYVQELQPLLNESQQQIIEQVSDEMNKTTEILTEKSTRQFVSIAKMHPEQPDKLMNKKLNTYANSHQTISVFSKIEYCFKDGGAKWYYYEHLARAMTESNEVWNFIKHFDVEAKTSIYSPLILELQVFIAYHEQANFDHLANRLTGFLNNSRLLDLASPNEIRETCGQFLQARLNPTNKYQTDYVLSDRMQWVQQEGKGNSGLMKEKNSACEIFPATALTKLASIPETNTEESKNPIKPLKVSKEEKQLIKVLLKQITVPDLFELALKEVFCDKYTVNSDLSIKVQEKLPSLKSFLHKMKGVDKTLYENIMLNTSVMMYKLLYNCHPSFSPSLIDRITIDLRGDKKTNIFIEELDHWRNHANPAEDEQASRFQNALIKLLKSKHNDYQLLFDTSTQESKAQSNNIFIKAREAINEKVHELFKQRIAPVVYSWIAGRNKKDLNELLNEPVLTLRAFLFTKRREAFVKRHPCGPDDSKVPTYYKNVIEQFEFKRHAPGKIAFMVVAHFVHTLPYFLEAISSLGDVVALISKQSGTVKTVRKSIVDIYKDILVPQLDKNNLKIDSTQAESFFKNLFGQEQWINHQFIILDHGGYFAPRINDVLKNYSNKIIGVVEHTWNGEVRYQEQLKPRSSFPLPVLSVAHSTLKGLESEAVANSIVDALNGKIFTGEGISQTIYTLERILIIGYGHIGKAVATVLKNRLGERAKEIIAICDLSDRTRKEAKQEFSKITKDKRKYLKEADLIITATSTLALTQKDFSKLKSGAFIACATSSDDQITEDALQGYTIEAGQTKKIQALCPKYKHERSGKYFYLIAKGDSVNFTIGSTPHPIIHIVLTSILVDAHQLIKHKTASTWNLNQIELFHGEDELIKKNYEAIFGRLAADDLVLTNRIQEQSLALIEKMDNLQGKGNKNYLKNYIPVPIKMANNIDDNSNALVPMVFNQAIQKILLSGGYGIGKTFLLHYLMRLWQKNPDFQKEIPYVFHIRLSLFNDDVFKQYSLNTTTLIDFTQVLLLLKGIQEGRAFNSKAISKSSSCYELFSYELDKHPERFCFFIDNSDIPLNHKSYKIIGKIVEKLLKGQPQCKVVMASSLPFTTRSFVNKLPEVIKLMPWTPELLQRSTLVNINLIKWLDTHWLFKTTVHNLKLFKKQAKILENNNLLMPGSSTETQQMQMLEEIQWNFQAKYGLDHMRKFIYESWIGNSKSPEQFNEKSLAKIRSFFPNEFNFLKRLVIATTANQLNSLSKDDCEELWLEACGSKKLKAKHLLHNRMQTETLLKTLVQAGFLCLSNIDNLAVYQFSYRWLSYFYAVYCVEHLSEEEIKDEGTYSILTDSQAEVKQYIEDMRSQKTEARQQSDRFSSGAYAKLKDSGVTLVENLYHKVNSKPRDELHENKEAKTKYGNSRLTLFAHRKDKPKKKEGLELENKGSTELSNSVNSL